MRSPPRCERSPGGRRLVFGGTATSALSAARNLKAGRTERGCHSDQAWYVTGRTSTPGWSKPAEGEHGAHHAGTTGGDHSRRQRDRLRYRRPAGSLRRRIGHARFARPIALPCELLVAASV